jgi:DNA-binding IclR family transcriptional regulator
MHELARLSGETVQVCGRDQDMMVVFAMEDGTGHFNVSSRVGSAQPAQLDRIRSPAGRPSA